MAVATVSHPSQANRTSHDHFQENISVFEQKWFPVLRREEGRREVKRREAEEKGRGEEYESSREADAEGAEENKKRS